MTIYINYRSVIPKLYSKFMEDSENIIKMHQKHIRKDLYSKPRISDSKQAKHPPQNISSFSAYQNLKGVQNVIKQYSNTVYSQQQWLQHILYVKILLFGISSIQFSILFGLLIVQVISSIFSIYQFALAGFFNILIHIALWVMVWIGTKDHQHSKKKEQREIFSKKHATHIQNKTTNILTQQKISPLYHQRGEVKTKKIQAVELQPKIDYFPQGTLKKVQISPKIEEKEDKNQKEAIYFAPRCCLVIKLCQVILTISLVMICMIISSESSQSYNKTILILSVLAILIEVISSISFAMCICKMRLYRSTHIINENQSNPLSRQNEYQIQYVQNHTVTSIDNAFHIKKDDILQNNQDQQQKIPDIKIKEQINPIQTSETQKSSNNHQIPKSISQAEKIEKNQLKKSVLKTSRGKMEKSDKTPAPLQDDVDNIISKRKVEINQMKIQYFEYSQSGSFSNSTQEQPPKSKSKSKYSEQKIKYLQKKLQIQAKMVKKKIDERRVVSAYTRNHTKAVTNKKDVQSNQNQYLS